jgi:uncharacterized protein (TIGR02145 family)
MNYKKIFNVVGVVAVTVVFSIGCSEKPDDDGEITGDPVTYDGKTYKTVKIGNQTWFAENLNYAVEGSKCYGEGGEVDVYDYTTEESVRKTLSASEIQSNCAKYGRLYDWSTAKIACPSGWHLPNDAEWVVLVNYAGGSETAGTKLKSSTGWNSYEGVSGNGKNNYGFSALPGGVGDNDGDFFSIGYYGYWWSATEAEDNAQSAWNMSMASGIDIVYRNYRYEKTTMLSVRCVQD